MWEVGRFSRQAAAGAQELGTKALARPERGGGGTRRNRATAELVSGHSRDEKRRDHCRGDLPDGPEDAQLRLSVDSAVWRSICPKATPRRDSGEVHPRLQDVRDD